jgi:hypothetical protein
MDEGMKVRVSGPDFDGDNFLDERRDDGSLVLRPETSAAAIRKRLGSEPMSAEEFERQLGHLSTDRAG